MNVAIIVEGGLVRAAYVDGKQVEPDVFDLDLEGQDVNELLDLRERINETEEFTDLRKDLLTYRYDVERALSYGDGLGA